MNYILLLPSEHSLCCVWSTCELQFAGQMSTFSLLHVVKASVFAFCESFGFLVFQDCEDALKCARVLLDFVDQWLGVCSFLCTFGFGSGVWHFTNFVICLSAP